MILRKFTSDIAAVDFIENCTNSNSIFVSLEIQIIFHTRMMFALSIAIQEEKKKKKQMETLVYYEMLRFGIVYAKNRCTRIWLQLHFCLMRVQHRMNRIPFKTGKNNSKNR